ncbi:hypothetical protein N483_14235 [Pseudoalteromonas luteoviolacea NCIMB 1944]|uniref:Uncharacterized protein n=1 Tax=Pseudoalteromonas luteoviolacea (strain 2ta16) TaxID=1353533 RepID=V4GZI6_PSEL2|nr:hypothetical protein PL2TA16_01705 [Pseudoalteromonas luteoviolacea 2ta16]KZN41826.1 hypothetical protein N483_14235 [Pseudoalteromonas luteoviolacea NCIMB 1944]
MSLLKLLLFAVFVLQIVLLDLALYIPSIVIAASCMLYFLKRYNALSHMGLAALGLCLSYGFLSIRDVMTTSFQYWRIRSVWPQDITS